MAELRAPEQNRLLGQLARMLRTTEGDIAAPEFLPRGLDVMGLVRQLMLPSAETVEKMSYGDPLFRMPTQSNIPITADREYLAEVLGMAPAVPAASKATTRLSNEAADQLVRAITRNPEATAPQVLEAAGEMAPLSRIFVGKKSKVWDKQAEKDFLALEKDGLSPEELWQQTGTVRGPEGKLRQEISDAEAQLLVDPKEAEVMSMQKAFSHPSLYEAYPGSKYISYVRTMSDEVQPGTGMFYPPGGATKYGELVLKPTSPQDAKETVIHELQHAAQFKEDFAPGGSRESAGLMVDDIRWNRIADEHDTLLDEYNAMKAKYGGDKKIPKAELARKNELEQRISELRGEIKNFSSVLDNSPEGFLSSAYRHLGGEAEARLAERRMNLTPEERRQYFPYTYDPRGEAYGMDVRPKDLLIPYGLLNK